MLVGLTGGIACYKVPYLVRFLGKQGVEVRVVMTESATKLITPLTLETVSRHQVYTSMFAEREFVGTRHIDLANWPDLKGSRYWAPPHSSPHLVRKLWGGSSRWLGDRS